MVETLTFQIYQAWWCLQRAKEDFLWQVCTFACHLKLLKVITGLLLHMYACSSPIHIKVTYQDITPYYISVSVYQHLCRLFLHWMDEDCHNSGISSSDHHYMFGCKIPSCSRDPSYHELVTKHFQSVIFTAWGHNRYWKVQMNNFALCKRKYVCYGRHNALYYSHVLYIRVGNLRCFLYCMQLYSFCK